MRRIRWTLFATALVGVAMVCSTQIAAGSPQQSPSTITQLSPYWGHAIQRWEPIIVEEAHRRGLDPDLIAAVIWKESLGRPYARGPAGAVGLMMVMPKEAGFPWRPTARGLENPHLNVFWGTRTLSIILGQSHGDLYSALAAYNGGWGQIHLSGPRRYAEGVLSFYARALALRYGLPPEGHWVATVAALDSPNALTVFGPRRPFTRYSRRPIMADIPDAVTDGLPSALVFYPTGEGDLSSRIGIWVLMDGHVVRDMPEPGLSRSRPSEDRVGPSEAWAPILSSHLLPTW
ncbi:MAG: transglycosylase SLT domain-containing protein [Anaerolineae bacterium]